VCPFGQGASPHHTLGLVFVWCLSFCGLWVWSEPLDFDHAVCFKYSGLSPADIRCWTVVMSLSFPEMLLSPDFHPLLLLPICVSRDCDI
jgi:hypothetical protein